MIHTVSPMVKVETCFNLAMSFHLNPFWNDPEVRVAVSSSSFGQSLLEVAANLDEATNRQSSDIVSFMVTQLCDCGQASFPQGPPVFTILVRSFVVRDVTDMAKIRLQVAKAVGSPEIWGGLHTMPLELPVFRHNRLSHEIRRIHKSHEISTL